MKRYSAGLSVCLSVRSSVFPIDGQQQRHAAGLLQSAPWEQEISIHSRRRRSAATASPRSTTLSINCGQCHVDSQGTRPNADLIHWL